MKKLRWLFILLGCLAAYVLGSWGYTVFTLANARRAGVYPSAEAGMVARMDKYYAPDHEVKIYYAGPNSRDGSQPFIWYVVAEVRASARADGSELGRNGCDNPGSFFLQTKEGWVYIPEGAFPGFIGDWMEVFDLAGNGQSTPSTDLVHGPQEFCR